MARSGGAIRSGDWTDMQLSILSEHAGKLSAARIGAMVGKSAHAVHAKFRHLGIKGLAPSKRQWTKEEIETLQRDGHRMTGPQLAKVLGIPRDGIWRKVRELGIKLCDGWSWPPEAIDQVRALAPTHTVMQIATIMGRPYKSVSTKARDLGIVAVPARKIGVPRQWAAEEIVRLHDCHAKGIHYEAAAHILGRSHDSIQKKAHELGIYLPRTPRFGMANRREREARPTAKRAKNVMAKAARPIIRREVQSRLEWCACGSPVSNWTQHYERTGHRRPFHIPVSFTTGEHAR